MAETAMGGILLAASYSDWKMEKIPNWLILAGLVPLMVIFIQIGSLGAVLCRILSMIFVFLMGWQIYIFGGLGAGDVKLFILLAGVCGLNRLLYIAVIAFALAGIYALIRNLFLPRGERKGMVILAPFVAVAYYLVAAGRWWM